MDSDSISNGASAMTICLFIVTALASQLMQHETQRKREEHVIGQRYLNKRLAERMSYDDLQDYLDAISALRERNDQVCPRQNMDDTVLSEKGGADKDLENEFDFHPKNSNWSHFEECLDLDPIYGSAEITGEDDNDSSSSEEAFLWTSLTRKKSLPKELAVALPPPLRVPMTRRSDSWGVRIRKLQQTVGSLILARGDSVEGDREWLDEGEHGPSEMYAGNESNQRYTSDSTHHDGMAHHNRAARAHYNARIMPNKVVMVRHGQSEGNVDERLYSTTPDNAMRLTRLGWEQALKTGQILKERVIATGEPVHFIVSPYVRTVETFHGMVSAWCDPSMFNHIKGRERRLKAWYGKLLELGLTWHEDPRIREQDFGNYQDPAEIKLCKEERHNFGAFFYRFPHGESASDVFDRVSTFLDSLWRSFDLNKSRNYVLVTHGISIRVLLARYFRYTIDQFSMLANPRNCEMVILGHDGEGKLRMDGRCELELELDEATGHKRVKDYTFQRRLRVLPKQYVHKLKVRISPDDILESSASSVP